MKHLLSLLLPLCIFGSSFAQDPTVQQLKKETEKVIEKDPTDTIPRKWKTGGLLSFTINQGALSNWSAGGEKFSFSLNAALNVFAFYKQGKHSWDNNLDLAYGIVNTTSLGNRKSSDLIYVASKYGYEIKKHLNLSVLGNIRTQFADGYVYNKTAAGVDSGSLTSKSFQPAYVVLGLGVDYRPTDYFSLFVSPITGRWVIVSDNMLAPLYGVPNGKNASSEFGAFLSANIMKKIGENMAIKSKLELFSNYLNEPQNIDIFWSTVYTAKISKFINFSFNFDLVYDNDTKNVDPTKGPAPQIMELMGIGFAYNFNNKKKH